MLEPEFSPVCLYYIIILKIKKRSRLISKGSHSSGKQSHLKVYSFWMATLKVRMCAPSFQGSKQPARSLIGRSLIIAEELEIFGSQITLLQCNLVKKSNTYFCRTQRIIKCWKIFTNTLSVYHEEHSDCLQSDCFNSLCTTHSALVHQ